MPWRRKPDEDDLDRELKSHLDLEAQERREAGMPLEEARYAAQRTLGNQTLLKEAVREIWGADTFGRLRQDLRQASRMLRKSPGFTLAAVATLALGIGANTAMFGVVNAILLRPLPFREPDRLIAAWSDAVHQQASLVILRNGSHTTEYAAYSGNTEFNLTGQGEPARLAGSLVSANLLSVFGEPPLLGRGFENGEDTPGRDRVVILSYAIWQQRFRGDPNIVGRTITLDEIDRQVVGVMSPSFRFPTPATEIWVPVHIDRREDGNYFWVYNLNIVGRLRPGITPQQAQAELRTFIPQIRDSFPWKMWPDFGMKTKIISLQESLVGDVRTRLLVLLAAVGLVLLIACANVANLLLASGTSRQKEISVRTALGASHSRIVRQLLTESLLLAFAGGGLGLLLAFALGGLFRHVLPADLPQLAGAGMDLQILGFTAAMSLATGLGFGAFPALRFSRADLQGSLKSDDRTSSGTRSRQRLSTALVAFEIALGVVVVIGAGLLARSFWGLINVSTGLRTAHTLTALVTPNPSLCKVVPRCAAFYEEALDRARALPGVEAAAAVNPLPFTAAFGGAAVELEGHPLLPGHPASSLWASTVTPEYFATMGIPILAGRGFRASDGVGAEPVVLVTAATAQRWWPGQNPIGKHLKYTWLKEWRTVVGVVGNTLDASLAGDPDWLEGHFYVPFTQAPLNIAPRMTLLVKTAGDPLLTAEPLRQLVAAIRPDVPVSQIRSMEEVISDSLTTPRSTMWLLFSFAALALLLSSVGIYAVVAYTVAQRTREIGIRMALGARAQEIVRGILGRSLMVTGAGLAMGIAGAFAATRVLRSFLFHVTATDTVTFVAMPLALLAVAMLATYVPARRASRVDPAVTLRYE